jgi:hypothetical protein
MAENIFDKILENHQIQVAEIVLQCFAKNFPAARSIEWNLVDTIYEAVFYETDLEKIVRISANGSIIDTKINLTLNLLPSGVQEALKDIGEIMNIISIQTNNKLRYELIVRDQNLIRYTVLVNELGEILKKKLL